MFNNLNNRGENPDKWVDLSQVKQLGETEPDLEFFSSFSHNLKRQAMIAGPPIRW